MSDELDRSDDNIRDALAWTRNALNSHAVVIREAMSVVDARDHKMLIIYLKNARIEAAKVHEQLLRAEIAAERYRQPEEP
jgi:hypothetical protein